MPSNVTSGFVGSGPAQRVRTLAYALGAAQGAEEAAGSYPRCRRENGMDYGFHELRHFIAASLAASAVGVRTIADRLGHVDRSLTLRTYAHWLESADREAAEVVEGGSSGPQHVPPSRADRCRSGENG